ncbi:MAG: hypothetical protein IPP72_03945 [Chitinophagaceae bacterium]|nr:hypothetical protein [Chitinophagaceae bacterium]
MSKILIVASILSILLSCNAQSSQKKNSNTVAGNADAMMEGKDYVILKRFRIQDRQGFNQPIEASSFVLPATWKVNGMVQWNGMSKCIPEIVQASIQAVSADGDYELMMFPVTQFDWSDDPVYLDAMQRGFNLHSCNIAQPLDAAGYIRNTMAPYLKAQVKTAGIITALQQQMDAGAAQMTQQARQAGNNAYSHRGSAAESILQFKDGKEGLAFCTLMQTIVTLPGTQGGMANNYQCYVSMRMVLKYKQGSEAMARKIMSTFFSSARVNPQWASAIQNMYLKIGIDAQDQTWKQIQIAHAAQQEISNNIVRSWEASNKTTGSKSLSDNDGFGQYLRGVENYTDESGNTIELTSGYNHAWSKGDGSYLLSNNPAFDPNVTFNEDWKRLNK